MRPDASGGRRDVACPGCGFDFDEVGQAALGRRLNDVTRALCEQLDGAGDEALDVEPAEGVWSARQYAAHVRDVLFNLRDRALLALLEDDPHFAPIHRDERAAVARYSQEPTELIAAALVAGAQLLGFLYDRMDPDELTRTGVYAGQERDVLWIGRNALHEATHHLRDVERCLSSA